MTIDNKIRFAIYSLHARKRKIHCKIGTVFANMITIYGLILFDFIKKFYCLCSRYLSNYGSPGFTGIEKRTKVKKDMLL